MAEQAFRVVYPAAAELFAESGFDLDVVRERFGNRSDWDLIAGMLEGSDGVEPHSVPGETNEWYRPRPAHEYWPAHLALLIEKKRWDEQAVQSIDIASTRVMQHLFDPRVGGAVSRYGLVIGHVQSGKTANFTAVIAKAADAGYNFVVVLTGLYNDLRDQTQARLCRELMGTLEDPDGHHLRAVDFRTRWKGETEVGADFHDRAHPKSPTLGVPTISVMKKNVNPLERMVEWIDTFDASLRASLSVLIIDDEADHASVNTMTGDDTEDYKGDAERSPSKINVLLRQLIGRLARVAYVGYTATPFANVFIDPRESDDGNGATLYPRDFIVSLPKPPAHFGLEEVFGADPDEQQLDHVVIVPQREAEELRDMTDDEDLPSLDVPQSMVEALMDYLIAGAVRCARGDDTSHHTMMVHTKHTVLSMKPLVKRIRALVQHFKLHLLGSRSREGRELAAQFGDRYASQFTAKGCPEPWEEVRPALLRFVGRRAPDVREINMNSDDLLDFDPYKGVGLRSVAVGGNRLSRGLTLEGLCTSFFIRPTTTHDTLMQMSRWFGFRQKHQDLIRVHVTSEIAERFTGMVQVERELRDDLERYEQQSELKPIDFGVRVLKQEGINPTRPGARRNIGTFVASGSEDRKIFFTGHFHFRREDLLVSNLREASSFVKVLGRHSRVGSAGHSLLWRDADPNRVVEFLEKVDFPEQRTWPKDRILAHIERRRSNAAAELSAWSVALIGLAEGQPVRPLEEWGAKDIEFVLPKRTRLAHRDSIGTLPGAWDFVIDLDGSRESYMASGKQTLSYNRMWEKRRPENPLLLIYVVDKASSIRATTGRQATEPRTDLFRAGEEQVDLLGLALTFPEAPMTAAERLKQREYWIRNDVQPFPGL